MFVEADDAEKIRKKAAVFINWLEDDEDETEDEDEDGEEGEAEEEQETQ